MEESSDVVHLEVAKTPFEARLIATVLEGAGIDAYVEGGNLMDEFAVSQALMNAGGVTIMVREDQLDAAQEAIAAARRSAGAVDADSE